MIKLTRNTNMRAIYLHCLPLNVGNLYMNYTFIRISIHSKSFEHNWTSKIPRKMCVEWKSYNAFNSCQWLQSKTKQLIVVEIQIYLLLRNKPNVRSGAEREYVLLNWKGNCFNLCIHKIWIYIPYFGRLVNEKHDDELIRIGVIVISKI